jgi:hypothetical protein
VLELHVVIPIVVLVDVKFTIPPNRGSYLCLDFDEVFGFCPRNDLVRVFDAERPSEPRLERYKLVSANRADIESKLSPPQNTVDPVTADIAMAGSRICHNVINYDRVEVQPRTPE